jgi:hypothetical protein
MEIGNWNRKLESSQVLLDELVEASREAISICQIGTLESEIGIAA